MLALGGRGLRDGFRRLDGGTCGRRSGLEPADIAAGGKCHGRAQQHRRSPKAAAHPALVPCLVPSRRRHRFSYSHRSGGLILADLFNLPYLEHFDPRPTARLDPAADPNPSIFERLKRDSRRLEGPQHAP